MIHPKIHFYRPTKKAVIAFLVGLIIGGGFFGYQYFQNQKNTISSQEAGKKAIDFINKTLEGQEVTASLIAVSDEGEVYGIHLQIAGSAYDSYMTKSGKFLFPSGFNLEKQSTSTEGNSSGTTSQTIPTTDKPTIDLYVMAFCPYGNQAEDTMLPVYNLLKDKVDWNIHYIVSVNNNTVSSLHGSGEVTEDEREVCVLKNYGIDKWWKFATYVNDNCGSDGSCWQDAAKNAGVAASVITNCVSSQGLSLMKDEAATTNKAGVSGSPTLIINGVQTDSVYQYGNSQAYLEAICSGFNSAPNECSQQLSTSSNSSSNSGSCQ